MLEKINSLYKLIIVCFLFVACVGCSNASNTNVNTVYDTGFVSAMPGVYDSADTAIVISKNTVDKRITFQTTAIGKRYTLYYDGATTFEDKYGTGMSLEQVNLGDIVDVTFVKDWKRLNSLKLASGQFAFKNQTEYVLSDSAKHMYIADEQYNFDKNLVVISENGDSNLMDINPVDVLSFAGYDHTIYSIVVEQSHGYIRLINDSYFVGGWIEINQNYIYKIDSEMMIAAPVGTYNVSVSNAGSTGTELVTVNEGEEYELDVSKWQTEAKFGDILFTLNPDTAKVYIDGSVVDTSEAVNLEFGIHQLIVVADGYKTISKYLKVNSEAATLDIEMDKKDKSESVSSDSVTDDKRIISANGVDVKDDEDDEDDRVIAAPTYDDTISGNEAISDNSAEKTDPTDVISTGDGYKVFINSPEDVEVYVDGNYVGLAPVSFAKKEGQVVVTLRKEGYHTRSYTISLDGENENVNYSFSPLTVIE